MNLLGTFRVALRAILRNRLRSMLTMLGIIIGVGAFVAMLAIGEGAKSKVLTGMAGMGSNMLTVFPGSVTQGGARGGMGSASTLTGDDAASLEGLSAVRRAAPVVRIGAQVAYAPENWSAPIYGSTPGYFEVRSWPITQGAAFTEDHVRTGAKVCVLGLTVVRNLFGEGASPIGEVIRVKDLDCRVVGVLGEKGANAWGSDEDDVVLMPWTTVKRRLSGGDPQIVNTIVVSATSPETTAQAQAQIEGLLRQRHRIREGQPDDFMVRDLRAIAQSRSETADVFKNLLGGIALVSLIVGGIGIMNIMLVSVTERTREIGIRVAMGARGIDILTQFLVESVMLCVLGGGLGIGAGFYGAELLADSMGVPPLISATTVGIAFGFAAAVGVIFGLYPAVRAARLDPIEALRYE